MSNSEISLQLTFAEEDADAERIDDLRQYLARDLVELGVESAERQEAPPAPAGAKGEGQLLGALAVVTAPALIPSLFSFLQVWAMGKQAREVTIKTPAGLEVTFVPEKPLSEEALLALVKQLTDGAEEAGPIPDGTDINREYRAKLLQLLTRHFDDGALRTICFELGIEYDDLPAEGRANKARELISYLDRGDRIPDLLDICEHRLPQGSWQEARELYDKSLQMNKGNSAT